MTTSGSFDGQTGVRRVAIVTGATSGIGLEVSRRLHHDGLAVVLTGRDDNRGQAIASELGHDATFLQAELTEPAAAGALMTAAVEQFGRLDVVVNNAGIDHTGDLVDVPMSEIRATFEVNTFAAILVLQEAAKRMTNGGVIVNVTSRLASVGVPTMSVYSASKGAILALTRAAAVELAPRQIRVNAVAPGMTRTALYDAWLADQQDPTATEAGLLADIPLGRVADPADVAAAISFLASPQAAYITGATLPVDGGYTAR